MFNTDEGKRILKWGGIVMTILAVFLIVQVVYTLRLTADVGRNNPALNVIIVNGSGEVFAVPDVATFSFGVRETAATVATAQSTVTTRINQALGILKAAGIKDKDIKTIAYNINPHYEYSQAPCTQFSCPPGNQRLTGYDVSQMIEVKVRDTSKAGEILGALGPARVTDVSGISFTIDDQDALEAEARALAIADAREKAKVLVNNLDVRLGRVVSYDEGYGYDLGYRLETANYVKGSDASQSVPPEVPVGENKIVSNVSVTYEIR